MGGPSGGCVPVQHLNTPVDYESIIQLGAIVGSGGMIVMDEDKCVVDVARFFMEFCKDESCGKCTPCRVGTQKMLEILTRICEGEGREGDIETLEKWADIIRNTALCGLGQTAPTPCFPPSATFGRSTRRTSGKSAALPWSAPRCSRLPACTPARSEWTSRATWPWSGPDDWMMPTRCSSKPIPFPSICGRVCDHQLRNQVQADPRSMNR